MAHFEDRLQVRELLRTSPSAAAVDEALDCVLRSPGQFEHPDELQVQLRALRDTPGQARWLRCRGLLPPVSRQERAALERRRAEAVGTGVGSTGVTIAGAWATGAWGLGGE